MPDFPAINVILLDPDQQAKLEDLIGLFHDSTSTQFDAAVDELNDDDPSDRQVAAALAEYTARHTPKLTRQAR